MKRKTKRAAGTLGSRRGSSIVSVLVTMAFVSVMGVVVLFVSLTGYQLKAEERQGKSNFYDAETAMNELRAGVQQTVSDAIATAYTDVLVHYGSIDADDVQTTFEDAFMDALVDASFLDRTTDVDTGDDVYSYDAATMKTAYITANPGSVTVSSAGAAELEDDVFVLKNLFVKCTTDDGYESNVSTDLAIRMPDFVYRRSGTFSTQSLENFISIAKEQMTHNSGGARTLKGSAYAGSVLVSGSGNALDVKNGSLICKGGLSVRYAACTVEDTAALWAGRVTVGAEGTISLLGTANVADDLELADTGASATLAGIYYGFGNSESDAGASSAIVVNGRDTELDLSGLDVFMLAGHSFIKAGYTTDAGSVLMGESISAKSNQTAYLVPTSYLSVGANPYLYYGDTLSFTVDETGLEDDYGADYKLVTYTLDGSVTPRLNIAYFFLDFDNPDDANAYFTSYFSANKSTFEKYVPLYSDVLTEIGSDSSAQSNTAGNTIYLDGTTLYRVAPSTADLTSTALRLDDMFGNLCVTLSANYGGAAESPYENLVKTSAVNALSAGTHEFYNDGGDLVAIIARGNYTVSGSTLATVHFILATGDVTVSRNFTGLIVSGGDVMLGADLTSITESSEVESGEFETALGAKDADGNTLISYLNLDAASAGGGSDGGTSNWDLNDLVTYTNWKKS